MSLGIPLGLLPSATPCNISLVDFLHFEKCGQTTRVPSFSHFKMWLLRGRSHEGFSPFGSSAELKFCSVLRSKCCKNKSCDYKVKVSARFSRLKYQPGFNKQAENFHTIAHHNMFPCWDFVSMHRGKIWSLSTWRVMPMNVFCRHCPVLPCTTHAYPSSRHKRYGGGTASLYSIFQSPGTRVCCRMNDAPCPALHSL